MHAGKIVHTEKKSKKHVDEYPEQKPHLTRFLSILSKARKRGERGGEVHVVFSCCVGGRMNSCILSSLLLPVFLPPQKKRNRKRCWQSDLTIGPRRYPAVYFQGRYGM